MVAHAHTASDSPLTHLATHTGMPRLSHPSLSAPQAACLPGYPHHVEGTSLSPTPGDLRQLQHSLESWGERCTQSCGCCTLTHEQPCLGQRTQQMLPGKGKVAVVSTSQGNQASLGKEGGKP